MAEAPTVSVIMPTHRRPEMIVRALRSLVEQTYQDFEIIIVDDNGEGHSAQQATAGAINSEEVGHLPVHYLINTASVGVAEARNTGIRQARGRLIAFLDDDEDWLPTKLERQVSLIDSLPSEVGAVDSGFYDWKKNGSVRTVQPKLQGWIFERLLRKTGGRAPKLSTLLCRSEVFEKVGLFDPQLPAREDYDLYVRIARYYRFESVFEPLANKRSDADNRLTGNVDNFVQGFAGVYRKIQEDLSRRPRTHAIFLLKYAEVLALAGRRNEAVTLYWKAFHLWFFNPRLVTYFPRIFSKNHC